MRLGESGVLLRIEVASQCPAPGLLCRRDSEVVGGSRGGVGRKATLAPLKCYVWLLNVLRLLNVELGLSGIRAKAISRETT